MLSAADYPEASVAIRVDLGAFFVSMELGKSTWLITSLSPGGGEKMSRHAPAAISPDCLRALMTCARRRRRALSGIIGIRNRAVGATFRLPFGGCGGGSFQARHRPYAAPFLCHSPAREWDRYPHHPSITEMEGNSLMVWVQ